MWATRQLRRAELRELPRRYPPHLLSATAIVERDAKRCTRPSLRPPTTTREQLDALRALGAISTWLL
jgi:hypothetical protein